MSDLASRAAVFGLVIAGLAVCAGAWALPVSGAGLAARYVQLLTWATGLALLAAAAVPVLRLPAVAVGVLAKLGFVAAWLALDGAAPSGWQPLLELALLVLIAACGAIFLLEARQQARWDGAPCLLRMES